MSTTDGATPHDSRGRPIAAVICVVLAILLTTPAALAYWGHRTLTDSQRYLATVGPLVDSPEVQDAIATKVTAAIEARVDVEAVLNDIFAGVITDAPRLEMLIGPMSGAINGLIEREVREFIASDAFADVWVTINTRAQQGLIRLLEGDDTGAISLQGDQVVLDVSDVIEQVQQRLVARGLTIAQNIPIPEVDKQIVLLDAPRLKQARTIYAFANPLAQWLIVGVAGLYVGALFLARRRPRMTGYIGLGLLANALFVGLALSIGRQLFVNELAGTVFGPASAVFYDTLLTYLQRGWQVLLGLGLILLVTAWFTGINASGAATRRAIAGTLETAGASMTNHRVVSVARWVAPNVRWLRAVAVVLGVLVLMWGNEASPARLLWAVVITIAVLAVLQVLVGASSVNDESGQDAEGPEGEAPAGEPVDSSASTSGTSS